jgi:hypothetical protein
VAAGHKFEVLFASVGSGSPEAITVFDIQICCFADIPHDLITSVTLKYATGQGRHGGDVSAVCFPLKDNCIAH